MIYGPRRCGKTTLLRRFLEQVDEPYLMVAGDDPAVRPFLSNTSVTALRQYVGTRKLLVVDEAQAIPAGEFLRPTAGFVAVHMLKE